MVSMDTSLLPLQAVLVVCLLFLHLPQGEGQGRLYVPLGRSSVWRAGVPTPANYDDHMLECGGYWYKKKRNDQCGLCGDPVDKPRDNEDGGKFSNGVITGSYVPGQHAQFMVMMGTNHGGYMEFKLCPGGQWIGQSCLDQHPIPMADGSGTRFYLPEKGEGIYTVDVIMPPVTCDRCLLQWTYTGRMRHIFCGACYVTGKAWAQDNKGQFCEGCGPQYQLRNCADISVSPEGSSPLMPSSIIKYNQVQFSSVDQSPFSAPSPDIPPPFRTDIPYAPPRSNFFPYEPVQNQRGNIDTLIDDIIDITQGNSIPYAPPQNQRNNDPWISGDIPSPRRDSSSPYAPPQNFRNNDRRIRGDIPPQDSSIPYASPRNRGNSDPWIGGDVPPPPRGISSPYAPPQNRGNNDPWIRGDIPSSSRDISIPYAPPQNRGNNRGGNNAADPWVSGGNPRDPWQNGGGPSEPRQTIGDISSQGDSMTPQLSCVAIGSKAGMKGMNEWCTKNCNGDYCPELYCSCW